MPATYDPIATQTLGSTTATVTFSSIPQTFTDLRMVVSVRSGANGSPTQDMLIVRFNNDTSTNYSGTRLSGFGTGTASDRYTNESSPMTWRGGFPRNDSPSGTFGLATIDLLNYTGSTFKTLLVTGSADQNGSGNVDRSVHLYRSTSAINRVDFTCTGGVGFVAGSTFTLYGILRA